MDIRYQRLGLLLILLLATILRFWNLNNLPPGLYHDEAYNGLDALSLLNEETFPRFYEDWELYADEAHNDRPPTITKTPLFFEGNYGREPIHIYLMALSIKLFGPTPFAIRFVPAAAGVLAVLTTYLATAAIVKRDWHFSSQSIIPNNRFKINTKSADSPAIIYHSLLPLTAAFVISILYSSITFSRFGLRTMLFVPVETAAVYCFWQGLNQVNGKRKNELFWFVMAGFWVGVGLYVHIAGRLLPFVFVLFASVWLFQSRGMRRRYSVNFLAMGITATLISAPLLLFFLNYPYIFFFRAAFVANQGQNVIGGDPRLAWLISLTKIIRVMFWEGETFIRHNLPKRPFLDVLQSIFFLLGLTYSLRRWRHFSTIFLLIWLFIMLVPTIISGGEPNFGRMTVASPAIVILISLGVYWFGLWVSRWLPPTLSVGLILLFLLISATLSTWDYFVRYVNIPQLESEFCLEDWQLGQYVAAQPPETTVYLTNTKEQMATIYFALEGNVDFLQPYAAAQGALPMGYDTLGDIIYLIRPSSEFSACGNPAMADSAILSQLQAYYPHSTIEETESGILQMQIKASDARPQPEQTIDHIWSNKIKLIGSSTKQESNQLIVTLYWKAEANIEQNYTAFIHLLNNDGELVAQLDRQPGGYPTSDWRVGEKVVDRYQVTLPNELPQGEYQIQTGFYYLPTLTALGEPIFLGTVNR